MTKSLLIFGMLLLLNPILSWNMDYVSQKLVLPIARGTQETLYCVCKECFDEKLEMLMKWVIKATMHP